MKALIKFAVVPFVAAGSLMGCLNADSVSSRDVAYNEIHVDAFTHTLTYERLNALEIRGDSIFSDGDYALLDTKVILRYILPVDSEQEKNDEKDQDRRPNDPPGI